MLESAPDDKRLKYSALSQHSAYLRLARRAEEAFEAQMENKPPDESSVPSKMNNFIVRGNKAIAAIMVEDIRTHLTKNYRYCTVCLMMAADRNSQHQSGASCTTVTLSGENPGEGWYDFRYGGFVLPGGTTCFNCLLPTVSSYLFLGVGQTNANC